MDSVDAELAKLGAVLVERRVLRRVIKVHRRIHGIGLQVPHETGYAVPRAELARAIDRDDLAVELDGLPERVILVPGDRARLAAGTPEALTEVWRAIFHARVHLAFDELLARNALGVSAVRARINRIGRTEFDEIRSVLRQEDLLLPPVDDVSIYVEFVALYLELRHFAPASVERTFPAVFDPSTIDETVALDLDDAALLAASRPARAPARPVLAVAAPAVAASRPPPLARAVPRAKQPAEAARRRGNRSRAAILAARSGDLALAEEDLHELAARLARVLGGGDPATWRRALLPVARFAATQRVLRFDPGARLLHDVQAACLDAERVDRVIDVAGWVLSRGKRPVIRALPSTREVRVAKRLHAAVKKIPACGVESDDERERLSVALHDMAERADANLRAALRPRIEATLAEVGLHPGGPPERVGQKKLVDELLDRAVAVGRLSLPDLRDAISRNDLKMPDLEVAELATGDPLLRADQILATSVDGVYRRGEVYLRFLQRISSLLFGTRIGRFLTLYLMLPLLGSFAIGEGLHHMIGPLTRWLWKFEPAIATRETLWGGAAFLFLVMHVTPVRRGLVLLLRGLWRLVRFVLYGLPRAVWRLPLVQRLRKSAFVRWVVKPAIPAAIALAIADRFLVPSAVIGVTGGVFAVFAIVLNLRFGRLVEEIVLDWMVRSARQLTGRILPGAVRYILAFFAKLVELFDRGVYRVDEWLRFRGRSIVMLVIKGLLGTIWGAIAYILRLYVNLFVEPTVNPIKHFPVVTVAAKLIIPFIPSILNGVGGPARRIMGPAIGGSFAAFTVIVLPGLAGFLVWELKENWKLYRAARSKTLRPLAIGHHGESMATLLEPGFHSGTIPKLFTRLRRAAWRDDARGVAKQREELHHVEEAVARFADRQLVSMVNEVEAFRATPVALHGVEIGSNRIHIALACPGVASELATIRFEQQSGWLVVTLASPGWIAALPDDRSAVVETALAGFYKLSDVDLVREQIEAAIRGDAPAAPPYDIAAEGLIVWPGHGFETEAIYDLHSKKLAPRIRGAQLATTLPSLRGRNALLGREPLSWVVWSARWRQIASGDIPPRIVRGPSLLG